MKRYDKDVREKNVFCCGRLECLPWKLIFFRFVERPPLYLSFKQRKRKAKREKAEAKEAEEDEEDEEAEDFEADEGAPAMCVCVILGIVSILLLYIALELTPGT